MVDMLKALKEMPFEIGAQYAQMFGLDPDSFLLLTEQLDLLEKQRALRKQMAGEAGLDMDEAARAGKEYAAIMRDITEQLGILKDSALIAILPYFKEFASVLRQVVFDWAKLLNSPTQRGGFTGAMGDLWDAIKLKTTGKLDRESVTASRAVASQTPGGIGSRLAGGRVTQETGESGAGALFASLERMYGLPEGLLDRMWAKESARGTRMLSPKGAMGHFQFMPETAKEYGLKDPNDLSSSAAAAARYMAVLMKRYGGDVQSSLAAYNWGMGNVDRKGLANAPWETRDYVQTITGKPITIEQNQHFHIASVDPSAAGREVGRSMDRSNAELVRNLSGAVR
jgi:soluble lytic murein transglycosylase-like protein